MDLRRKTYYYKKAYIEVRSLQNFKLKDYNIRG